MRKEPIREHNLEQHTSLMPPSMDNLARRLNSSTTVTALTRKPARHQLPTVVIESESMRQSKKMKLKKNKWRKMVRNTAAILATLFLMDKLEDWYSSSLASQQNEDITTIIQRDYSLVTGINDLTLDGVDAWCFDTSRKCKCVDPLNGDTRQSTKWWAKVHHMNIEAAEKHAADLDVLFLGDSITEGWSGKSRGHMIARAKGVKEIFTKFFTKSESGDGKFNGLNLGISGDTSPNLLWRIQNGELPDTLNPKVIWLLIGTNDFGNTWCSPEIVVIGIIRVIEELRIRKPKTVKIVVNGLLPRTYSRKGYVMRGGSSFWSSLTSKKPMPSFWKDIAAVNEELKHYCNAHSDDLQYFETKVFFENPNVAERDQLRIQNNLMPDRLHPSAEGYDLWGAEIVKVLDKLIQ